MPRAKRSEEEELCARCGRHFASCSCLYWLYALRTAAAACWLLLALCLCFTLFPARVPCHRTFAIKNASACCAPLPDAHIPLHYLSYVRHRIKRECAIPYHAILPRRIPAALLVPLVRALLEAAALAALRCIYKLPPYCLPFTSHVLQQHTCIAAHMPGPPWPASSLLPSAPQAGLPCAACHAHFFYRANARL